MSEGCSGCETNLSKFLIFIENEANLRSFLESHGLIMKSPRTCPGCANELVLPKDGLRWRCRKNVYRGKKKIVCNFDESINANTFFQGTHLSWKQVCYFVAYHVLFNPPRMQILIDEVEICGRTVVDWSSYIREVLIDWAFENSCKEKLGGEGTVVEIDEAKFGTRKHNKGRVIDGQWVFGGVERGTKKMFLIAVPDRKAKTLLKLIKAKIAPKTSIYSDCWKSYKGIEKLEKMGYIHNTVNHSENFVDPTTGAHTQTIERSWREVRCAVPKYGKRKAHYAGYLAEYIFKRIFTNRNQRIHAIFDAISKLYDPYQRKVRSEDSGIQAWTAFLLQDEEGESESEDDDVVDEDDDDVEKEEEEKWL